ncbi:MAG: MarR family winged helix-turn-helix transcriptional regulator [Armatimonadota bacterium]|jgi:DNA-binding MarR family transcriptional regulator
MSDTRDELAGQIDEFLRQVFQSHLRPRRKPAELELTLGQLDCLHAISRLETPSMSDLSGELGLPPSSVTGIVDRLVALGKVQRESDPEDRRVVRVALTAEGRRDRDRHRRQRRKRLARALSALDDDELRALHSALALVAEATDRSARQ